MTKLARVYVCTSGSLKYDFVLLEGYCSLSSKLHFNKEKKGGWGEFGTLSTTLSDLGPTCALVIIFFPPLKL